MTTPVETTVTSAKAWSPDVTTVGIDADKVISTALIIQATTKAGEVEGDEPAVRVPKIKLDEDVTYVREGKDIEEEDPDLAETVILTAKIAKLLKISREQKDQPNARANILVGLARALTTIADKALLTTPKPTSPAVYPPAGLLALAHDAGPIADNLDALIDAIAIIEGLPAGVATHIIASPGAYATLRQMKKGTGSNESLIGAGVQAGVKTLLDVPVLTTSAMPSDKILVIDKNYILSAYGQVQLADSDDYYFGSDNVAIRGTFRFGVQLHEAQAAQVLTI